MKTKPTPENPDCNVSFWFAACPFIGIAVGSVAAMEAL